ncbi:hypothetical protein HanIR_Chr08g0346141 [Helianthus annuus]|nr:hypothetical protein HanIR_Chr08g0346141 [Helianthus annuus]
MTMAIAINAPCRTKSVTSDVRGSNKDMASLSPVPAHEMPTAMAAPYRRTCGFRQ